MWWFLWNESIVFLSIPKDCGWEGIDSCGASHEFEQAFDNMLYNRFQGLVATESSWVRIWSTTEFSGLGLGVKEEVSQHFQKGRAGKAPTPCPCVYESLHDAVTRYPEQRQLKEERVEVGSIMTEKGADRGRLNYTKEGRRANYKWDKAIKS